MENIIEIDHLYKSYGSVKAVQDLSFRVKKGELFAFLGLNGAGKSTTISIMCGQLPKDGGRVEINGKNLDENPDKIKRELGVVFQNSVLDKPISVRENLKTRAALYGICGEAFDKRFIVTKIIPRFYGSTRDMDFWKRREDRFTNEIGAGFIVAKDSDVYIVFSDLSVIKCDKMAAMSDEDADVIMLSYASACREADPEKVIKKTYEFTASKNARISSHGYIINTKDFTLKRMEDVK